MGTCRGREYGENTWWGGGGRGIWSEYLLGVEDMEYL